MNESDTEQPCQSKQGIELAMQPPHPDFPEPLQTRIQTLRDRINRDEYLLDAMQVADKFIDLERILPHMGNCRSRISG
jgi:anti-sigma28 factor (negative regulator of flagellin synthesis)